MIQDPSPPERGALPPPARDALFFESPEALPQDAPRLLLISYNFPPDPTVGGLRWQEMARYFAAHGWSVDVVTRNFQDVSSLDRARLDRLSAGIRVFSVQSREPLVGRAQKIVWPTFRRVLGQRVSQGADVLTLEEMKEQQGSRIIVRAYLAWIEFARDENWAHAAATLGTAIVRTTPHAAVISSGPPHMAHEAGRLISVATGVPHVLDMRDPWSLLQRLPEPIASPTWIRLARFYERRAVRWSRLVTMNTEQACAGMRAVYPESADKIEVVRNGSDDEPLPLPVRDGCFRIRFAGSIYLDRDPRPIFRAARKVIDALALTPEDLMIEFAGLANVYAGTPTMQIADEEGIKAFVRVGGRLHRKRTLEFLAGASILLSLPQDSDFAVPAKIYEYVRFAAWMLVMAAAGSATAQLLSDTEADVLDPADIDEIAAVIRHRYEQFIAGVVPLPIGRDGRFDRRLQTGKMLDLIVERCVQSPRTTVSASPRRPDRG